jgi:hypothetical protein
MISAIFNLMGTIGTMKDIIAIAGGNYSFFAILNVIVSIIETAVTCIGSHSRDFTIKTTHNGDLNSVSPLPVQFKRVEVIEGNGTNGKTIQTFTNSDNYAIWFPTNPHRASKQRFATWAYGLPDTTTVLNASGNILQRTINTYDYQYAKKELRYCVGGHMMPCSNGLYTSLQSCKRLNL